MLKDEPGSLVVRMNQVHLELAVAGKVIGLAKRKKEDKAQ